MWAVVREPGNRPALLMLLYTTFAMFTLPLVAFFVARDYCGLSVAYSGFAAVAAVNVIMAGYAYHALMDESSAAEEEARAAAAPAKGSSAGKKAN